ncbi:hypothetical protein [Hansschlegelia zhihuaiae]|uniref:Flagellar protein FlaG n=1 Tax=Hansschlegelia zhihuaiae TaxID=405005 RepID=A0A4Q0M529_9HYPH|nr:hypothetical protein [Hansschlegelia zhihuaiae]RXF68098.1 hypothetical protein EK403_20555 [Hansschlegelia zhihuaiae]
MDAAIAPVTTPTAPVRRTAASAQRVEPSSSAPRTTDRDPPPAAENAAASESRLLAERDVQRDDATGSLVYRLIDMATGDVTAQTPSEARLKLRAYIDGLVARETTGGSFETTA